MTSAHSRLAPSASGRWVHCTGSVQLCEQFPELLENPAAAEGTAAHWVAYSMLTSHTPKVGELAPNGVPVTDEMVEGALLYVNHVFKLANPHGGLTRVRLEQSERMPSIHPEMFGTPDGSGQLDILELTGEIHVWDYKFGHAEVSPFENWQLVSYLRGILDRLDLDGVAEQYAFVTFHIIQPRCYTASGPIRSWRVRVADLRGMFNQLHMSAHEALGPNPRLRTGDHCKNCPGRRACPALKKAAESVMDVAMEFGGHQLPADALGLQLANITRAEAILQAMRTGLEQQAESLIRSGQLVPGWSMQPASSTLKWTVPATEVIELGELLEVPLTKPPAPITPTQAISKLKKAGIDTAVIDAYSKRESGAMRLTIDNSTLAKKVFSQ